MQTCLFMVGRLVPGSSSSDSAAGASSSGPPSSPASSRFALRAGARFLPFGATYSHRSFRNIAASLYPPDTAAARLLGGGAERGAGAGASMMSK